MRIVRNPKSCSPLGLNPDALRIPNSEFSILNSYFFTKIVSSRFGPTDTIAMGAPVCRRIASR